MVSILRGSCSDDILFYKRRRILSLPTPISSVARADNGSGEVATRYSSRYRATARVYVHLCIVEGTPAETAPTKANKSAITYGRGAGFQPNSRGNLSVRNQASTRSVGALTPL